jgi:hypothetical protein
MRSIFAAPTWESVSEIKTCSSCGAEGATYSVHVSRKLNGRSLHTRYYCGEFCQRTFELFLFRKCEANDERRRIFSYRSVTPLSSGLNTSL